MLMLETNMPSGAKEQNPKILHRIYFDNFKPYHDPYLHFLDSWRREMPDYTIMQWNMSNLDVHANEWVEIAWREKNPVFLAEYFRWHVVSEYGGVYLDADCEVLNGKALGKIIDELYESDEYDIFFGVEERSNGHPTAQTFGAKKGSELLKFMNDLYENSLPKLWHWRNTRGLIGPQLMALYFADRDINKSDDGFFKNIDAPVIKGRAKVYPQEYFSPKFSILGETLQYDQRKTCVYHMFANANMSFAGKRKMQEARDAALTFEEYRKYLADATSFPRNFDLSSFSMRLGTLTDDVIEASDTDGLIFYGPYISLPRGRYSIALHFSALPGRGHVQLSTYQDGGLRLLADVAVASQDLVNDSLSLTFEVTDEVAEGVEFLLHGRGIDHLVVDKAIVSVAAEGEGAGQRPSKPHMKLLHRIYFGFDGKPDAFAKYLDTWKSQLPDFEIVNWNASNLPMGINEYVRKLYKEKDHAFLTDYFRWWVLREYGGTYLDADVEVVDGAIYRKLIDELEASDQFDAFIGIDERGGGWYTAHSVASKPQSGLARFMCELYDNFGSFTAWRKKGFYFWAPQLVALYFTNQGHNPEGMGTSPNLDHPIVASRVKIYSQDWFSPIAPTGNAAQPFKLNGLSPNNCLCHHFACSWHDAESPYLQHSQVKGGQANVLLADIIKEADRRTFSIPASNLSIGVGRRLSETIETTGAAGCLSYGPYIDLKPGVYTAEYTLKSRRNAKGISIDIIGDFGESVVAAGEIDPGDVGESSFVFTFKVAKALSNAEFRVFVTAQTKIELSGIVVTMQ